MSGQVSIELYVDPCCPFAWIAYQWLAEVQQHRALELGLHLMSLAMLNEHQVHLARLQATPRPHLGPARRWLPRWFSSTALTPWHGSTRQRRAGSSPELIITG